jgi:lipopolysaccharide biosynthesis glycosyltransferase
LGRYDLADELALIAAEIGQVTGDMPSNLLKRVDRLRDSLVRLRDANLLRTQSAATAADDDTIRIGVLGYGSPDYRRSSNNLGDFIQTLAVLGQIARRPLPGRVDAADPELAGLLRELGSGIAPASRLPPIERPVELVEIDRDFGSVLADGRPLWLVSFGWHMHPHFGTVFDFPYPANVRPIFISFHVSRTEMLTSRTEEYLRRHGPVGCRDWTTVYILRERGVPCFFSGCVTVTTNAIFADAPPEREASNGVAEIDVAKNRRTRGAARFEQEFDEVRERTLAENLRAARARLAEYRSFAGIRTSRLHAFLPCAAMGLDVAFEPPRTADVRFDGLLGLEADPATLARMNEAMRARLAAVTGWIVEGLGEDEVYRRWRDLCRPDVEAADARCDAPATPATWPFDLDAVVGRIVGGARRFGPVEPSGIGDPVAIAFAVDAAMFPMLKVTLRSIVDHTDRPLGVVVLTRGVSEADLATLTRDFPDVGFETYDMAPLDFGDDLFTLEHITVSTMDRLMLPELIQDKRKIVYLDVDTLVLGDVGELQDLDLGRTRIAARSSMHPSWTNGYSVVYKIALRLEPDRAFEFRRLMHRRHDLRFTSFNAGVLVLDLDGMRADRFCAEFLPFVWTYRCHDQDVVNCYAGPDRVELPAVWNVFPSQEELPADARLLHWVGPVKPWSEQHVLKKDLWKTVADRAGV